jgi:hypothetical protein
VDKLDGYDDRLTIEQARQLAIVLTAAADEAEQMAGHDRTGAEGQR